MNDGLYVEVKQIDKSAKRVRDLGIFGQSHTDGTRGKDGIGFNLTA